MGENEVDEERVKSALEIAMERLSGLPELTPEEIVEQKEKQFKPIGEAIGRRFLQGMIRERDLLSELNRNREESDRIVLTACISTLSRSVQLEDFHTAERALTGLFKLAEDSPGFGDEIRSFWDRIDGEFKQQRADIFRKFEIIARKGFAELGITGSAIRPNIEENELFRNDLDSLFRSFEPSLEKFRSILLQKLQRDGN